MEYPEQWVRRAKQFTASKEWEGFVGGDGPDDADVMLIGESPGAEEVAQGRTFVGKAGSNLNEFIDYLQIRREQLYVTNTTKSRPVKRKHRVLKDGSERVSTSNRPPSKTEIKAHAPLLDYEIRAVQPQVIITLGNVPLKRLLGEKSGISELHGQLQDTSLLEWDENAEAFRYGSSSHKVFPLYHPAAIIYRRALKDVYYSDLLALKQWLAEGIRLD